ncbi:hypothetical protein [Acidocella aminolytica]|uniref:Uncharacterized protein n=1 Tax=Acidocella aminolytica 101 = DSM 11237 TaxID=1120923 RepID=A0A0D6PGT6_9PROT|nr:hypothetical protein [Acidocella aminolytica]GAN80413.1 hypothetical protein Aam_046_054 [Acidocella aminolytica 101 = DSM 11237]GBQ36255.1 hypothetical protein AA11237_1194 [Acidocella aminolytica 101 = DSM 11237]SHF45068.1 hypothetical protein SAMN02746095_03310 [Acidocella aminolytica 101 = DSM 11237]
MPDNQTTEQQRKQDILSLVSRAGIKLSSLAQENLCAWLSAQPSLSLPEQPNRVVNMALESLEPRHTTEINFKIRCLQIAHDLNERDLGVSCLESVAYHTGELAEWVFSGPAEYRQSRVQCLDLALRTLDGQLAVNKELTDDDEPPVIKVRSHLQFVLDAAKVYARFIEQDSWKNEKQDA